MPDGCILECTCKEKESNEETGRRSRKYFAQINCLARGVLLGLDNNVSYVSGSTVQSQTKQEGLERIFYLMYMYILAKVPVCCNREKKLSNI
jgi:hypothetical protein